MTLFAYNPKKKPKIGDYAYLITVDGQVNAEFLKGFLISNGIEPQFFKEAVSSAYAVNIGSLGEIDFYVKEEDLADAKDLLKDIEKDQS